MSEKILIAMVGGSAGDKPCGYMQEGYCCPLAAPNDARACIEAEGENKVAEWLEASGVKPPKAGGLWVLECEVDADDDDGKIRKA